MNIVVLEHFADLAAAFAGQRDDAHVGFVGGLDRLDDVGGVAGGRDGEQDIAGMAEAADLLGENLVERVVVADGGQDRAVGGQGDGGQFLALGLEAADQFGGEVLRVAGRSAVAAGENLAAIDQAVEQGLDGGGDRGRHQLDGVELGVGAVFEMLGDAGDQVHVFRRFRAN